MRWPRPLPRLLRRLRSPLLVIGAALAAALLIRAVAVDAYRIPTASMEPALLPGDLVLVEKTTLGARGPGPLARWRMPGLGTLRRGDVVVFSQPTQRRPLAQKTAFVKRVVGLPGDTVAIRAGRLLVNGIPFEPTPTLRDWTVHAPLSPDAAPVRAAGCHAPTCAVRERLEPGQWRVAATDAAAAAARQNAGRPASRAASARRRCFHSARRRRWTTTARSSCRRRGVRVYLSGANWPYLRPTLDRHEGVVARRDPYGRFLLGGQPVTETAFVQDYVFVLGDNRHASADSRHFGFVPADHLIGRAALVAFSWDAKGRLRGKRTGEVVR